MTPGLYGAMTFWGRVVSAPCRHVPTTRPYRWRQDPMGRRGLGVLTPGGLVGSTPWRFDAVAAWRFADMAAWGLVVVARRSHGTLRSCPRAPLSPDRSGPLPGWR